MREGRDRRKTLFCIKAPPQESVMLGIEGGQQKFLKLRKASLPRDWERIKGGLLGERESHALSGKEVAKARTSQAVSTLKEPLRP